MRHFQVVHLKGRNKRVSPVQLQLRDFLGKKRSALRGEKGFRRLRVSFENCTEECEGRLNRHV